MITVTTTYVRPSTDVEFFLDEDSATAVAFQELMETSANAPVYSSVLSPDTLTVASIAEYENQAELDGFLADLDAAIPTFFSDRDTYCAENDITIDRQEVEE